MYYFSLLASFGSRVAALIGEKSCRMGRNSLHLSVCPSVLAGLEAWLGGMEDGQLYGRTDRQKISPFYRIVPFWGRCHAMLVEQGMETADHLMPLGDWFFISQRIKKETKSCR